MRHLGTALLGAALLAGCATHNGVTTARTIGAGNVQVALEPGATVASAGGATGVAPTFNVAVRYGLSERAEIGGRLGTTSYEVLGKIQLNDPASDAPISIAPSGTVWFFAAGGAGGGWITYQVPLLFGFPTGDNELTVGPKLQHTIFMGGAEGAPAGAMLLSAGGGVAYSIKAGEKFRFHPELAVTVPVLGVASASGDGSSVGGAGLGFGAVLVGLNAGLQFGGN